MDQDTKDKRLNFIEKSFVEVVKKGGKQTTLEHGNARLEKCRGCKFRERVEPVPGLHFNGCTKCGCPFLTKAFMLYLGIDKLNVKIECGHPDGNKWKEIDNQFNQ